MVYDGWPPVDRRDKERVHVSAGLQPEESPLFSGDVHDIGTRLVDLLNQVSFLYRFPALAGVTLASITQHITPLRRLLDEHADKIAKLAKHAYPQGTNVGAFSGPDPLNTSYDYAVAGLGAFLDALEPLCSAGNLSTAQQCLDAKDAIEKHSERAAVQASEQFKPMAEAEGQLVRMVVFYFLLDLEKMHKPHL
jgi:hypothetical protein